MHYLPRQSVRVRGMVAAALLLALAAASGSGDPVLPDTQHGPLDGMRFVGKFGPADGKLDRDDALTFGEGQFWSAICVPCGFSPSTYWTRREGDEIHFRGEMGSVDRGHFRYAGVIRGKQLSAMVQWRKERWYRTINREFRFEGVVSATASAVSAAAVTQRARLAIAAPEPDAVCPL